MDLNLGRTGLARAESPRTEPAEALSAFQRALASAQRHYDRLATSYDPRRRGDPVAALMRVHRQVHPRAATEPVRHGYTVAEHMHRGQMRKSGEEYITHPLAVAGILAELGMDTTTLVAALLHDTVEDTSYDLATLAADFGDEVALLVDGVTKLDKAYFGDDAEIETIRKMLVKAVEDERVLVIKLADRLHNMRTLDARSPASRTRIATATLDTLVPLADRLGIQQLKRSLEDTVLRALEPQAYADIVAHMADRPEWTQRLTAAIATLRAHLAKAHIDATVRPRGRHPYSIWKDTIARGEPLDHDLPRVVVIVNSGSRNECYTALGMLHTLWRPVPGRFKDFIASPKNNLYRSLHTTVIGPGGTPLEVLIRTAGMHHFAEYGIVANFRDPLAASRLDPRDREEQLAWLHRVAAWQDVADDASRFFDALRCEVSGSLIQVFTAGRSLLLPVGSTPVDVAFTLDPNLGVALVRASVNGRPVALSAALSDGDIVEIVTREDPGAAASAGPAYEWLQFARSPRARLEISRWHASAARARADEVAQAAQRPSPASTIPARMRIGWRAIVLALHAHDRATPHPAILAAVAAMLGYPDFDAVAVAVADRKITPDEVAELLIDYVDRPAGEHALAFLPKAAASPATRRAG